MTQPLEPLKLLPRPQWRLAPCGDRHLAVTMHTRGGALYKQKWSVHDFPNDFFSVEDLERHGVLLVYMAANEQLQHPRTV